MAPYERYVAGLKKGQVGGVEIGQERIRLRCSPSCSPGWKTPGVPVEEWIAERIVYFTVA